jgi:phosphatidylethanolamine-binding protein (PEBP) family uncharacterized protein
LKNLYLLAGAAFCLLSLASCLGFAQTTTNPTTSSFSLGSPDFVDGGLIGAQFTCDGAGVSPALEWKNAPEGTKSFAVTMHHFPPNNEAKHVYMVVYDLPLITNHLERGSTLGSWGINTVNRKTAYTPPCSKGPGRKDYILTVYALSQAPAFSSTKTEITMDDFLLAATKTTTMATATLTVGYARP